MPSWDSVEIYQGYDLAIGKKDNNDFFVCTTIGVMKDPFKIYFLDWYRERLSFPEQVKTVKKLFNGPITPIWKGRQWRPLQIGIESNAYQVALAQQVLNDTALPVKEIISVKDKTTRITAGAVNYENGLVHLPVDHPQTTNLIASI
jgi:phage terminase large subunit-like protein